MLHLLTEWRRTQPCGVRGGTGSASELLKTPRDRSEKTTLFSWKL